MSGYGFAAPRFAVAAVVGMSLKEHEHNGHAAGGALNGGIEAIFRGLALGGASRTVVVAAAAAAVTRCLYSDGCPGCERGFATVEVPKDVQHDVGAVAVAMAIQRVVGELTGQQLNNQGQAYQVMHNLNPELAREVRAVNRISNIAMHGRRRGGGGLRPIAKPSSRGKAAAADRGWN